jgi:glycosyltransferase involved in cell wall biosynthesis
MDALIVTPSIALRSGGLAESVLGYLAALGAHGIATEVFAPACSDEDVAHFQARAPEARLTLATGFKRLPQGAAPALGRLVARRAGSASIVHVFGLLNPVSTLAARVAIRIRRPLVVCPLGMLSKYTYAHRRTSAKAVYFSLLEYPNLRRAQAVHFQSEPERIEAAWHGLPATLHDYVIPPPALHHTPVAARQCTAASHHEPLVVFLARLDPKKNLELLLDAWPAVRSAVPNARLAIAGDGDPRYVRTLETRAHELGEGSNVTFLGMIVGEAKAHLLAAADAFVLPSFHENFGIAVLEAISAGVPVVISPDVQLARVVEHHGLGLVAARSAPALAEAVIAVLGDRRLAEHVRATGHDVAQSLFSTHSVGERLREMYRAASDCLEDGVACDLSHAEPRAEVVGGALPVCRGDGAAVQFPPNATAGAPRHLPVPPSISGSRSY